MAVPFFLIPASGHHLHTLPLLCSRAPVSLRGELLQASGALVFTSGDLVFAAVTQGTPLDCLAMKAKGTCVPGFHGTVKIGKTVLGRPPPTGYYTDSRLKLIL